MILYVQKTGHLKPPTMAPTLDEYFGYTDQPNFRTLG